MFLFAISRVILITFIALLVSLIIIAILGILDILLAIDAYEDKFLQFNERLKMIYAAQITHDEIIDSKYLFVAFCEIIDLSGDRD